MKNIFTLWTTLFVCINFCLFAKNINPTSPLKTDLNFEKPRAFTNNEETINWSGNSDSYSVEVYQCDEVFPEATTLNLQNYHLSAGPLVISQIPDNLSGLTYNPLTNTLFAPMNSPSKIFELDLNGQLLRTINLIGFKDTEGLTWIGGSDYIVIEEERGRAVKITIEDSTIQIPYPSNVIQLPNAGGDGGLEGVTYNPATNELILVKEKDPRTLFSFVLPSNYSNPINITYPFDIDTDNFNLKDLSGLYHLGLNTDLCEMAIDDHFFVLSHQSEALVETDVNGVEYSRLNLKSGGANGTLADKIKQAEGVTVDHEGNVYVVSEPNLFYKFSNPNIILPTNNSSLIYTQTEVTGNSLTIPGNVLGDNTQYCWSVWDNDTNACPQTGSFISGQVNNTPTIIDVAINASSDDAEESADGYMKLNSSDLELVKKQIVGLRFKDLNIPQGAEISKAYIQFQADEVDDYPTSLIIEGEDTAHSQTFKLDSDNISNRPRTTASVAWNNIEEWAILGEASEKQRTPDLKNIIQEIVNKADWSPQNAMSFIITGSGVRTVESYDGGETSPRLIIEIGASCEPCALTGNTCDDNNACTINDVFDLNCNCVGTFHDANDDGIPDPCYDTVGTPTGNTGNEDCPFPWIDTDGDGVCDAADVCEGADDELDTNENGIPDGCEDGISTNENEEWLARTASTNSIILYPNPTQNFLNIEIQNITENGVLEIYDNIGRLMITQKVAKDQRNLTINTNEFSSGLYVAILKIENKERLIKRFIKENK